MSEITKRQKDIIKEIMDNNKYTEPNELSKKLQVSTRTIRNDISQINSLSSTKVIFMLKSKGYFIKDYDLAKKILDCYTEDVPITVEERTVYIISKLLYKTDSIDIFDLADEVMVSEHTIEKDLNKIKLLFNDERSNIKLKRIGNKVFLDGAENEKRSLLCKLILSEQKNNIFNIESYEKKFKNINIKEINRILREYFFENNIKINDLAIINLVVHILIVIEKIRKNFNLIDSSYCQHTLNLEDIKISNDICIRIEKFLNISIPEAERRYIALLISGKRTFIHKRSDSDKKVNDKINDFIRLIVEKLKNEYLLDLQNDVEFLSGITLHMENLSIRSSKGIHIQNPLIQTIKKVYPLIYDMGVAIAIEYERIFGYSLNDDEIGLIVLHLATAIEKLNEESYKIRCVVVCPIGVASSKLLKVKLLKLYSDIIEIVECISISKLESIKDKNIDLIISTVPLDSNIDIETVICSNFLINEDMKKIDIVLKSLANQKDSNDLYRIFDKKLFYNNIQLENKIEIIKYLSNKLYKEGYCPENYSDFVISREKASSTAYGGLVAIPHPLDKVAFKNKIAVAILDKPILWGEEKAQVVFLFCLDKYNHFNLNIFFEKLISLVENQDNMKKLINSNNFEEFINIFSKADN